MRIFRFPVVLVGLLVLVAGSAHAGTVDVIFTSTTGGGATGGSSIDAAPGDTLTIDVVLNIGDSDTPVSGYQVSLAYSGTNTVDQPTNTLPAGWFPLPTGTAEPNLYNFPFVGGDLFGNDNLPGGTTHIMGSANVVVNEAGTITPTLVASNADSIEGGGASVSGEYTFIAGTINVIPEPGTATLLGLGLGALSLAGRRRQR